MLEGLGPFEGGRKWEGVKYNFATFRVSFAALHAARSCLVQRWLPSCVPKLAFSIPPAHFEFFLFVI